MQAQKQPRCSASAGSPCTSQRCSEQGSASSTTGLLHRCSSKFTRSHIELRLGLRLVELALGLGRAPSSRPLTQSALVLRLRMGPVEASPRTTLLCLLLQLGLQRGLVLPQLGLQLDLQQRTPLRPVRRRPAQTTCSLPRRASTV